MSAIVQLPALRLLARGLIGLTNVIIPGKGLKEGPYVSEQELLALADAAVEEDVIEREERQLIHSIIEFGDTVVREVMVPRPDMVAIEARATVNDAMEVVMAAGYSRIPVYEQGIDDILGLLYTKDLMRAVRDQRAEVQVRELVRTANFVPETKRVAELLPEMQKQKSHMAIVVDEYGGTAGLVTLEDLIEELVGEIVDEYDVEEPPIEPLPGGDVRVNARMPIDELNELLRRRVPRGRLGHRRRARVQPARPRAGRGRDGASTTAAACGPSGCRAGASGGCASRKLEPVRPRLTADRE